MPQALNIPDAKAAVEKEWENWKRYRHGSWQKSETKKMIGEARNKGRKDHSASLMDLCHLKNSELEPQYQKYNGRVVLRGDIVKDDSGSYAVFTEQGSSASQMTAANGMDIISRLPGCAGQAADTVSAHTQAKMEDAPTLLQLRIPRYLDTCTETRMAKIMVQYRRHSCSSWTKCVRSSFGRNVVGKAIRESSIEVQLWESSDLGMLLSLPRKRTVLVCVCGRNETCWKEREHKSNMEDKMKDVDLREPTSFLDHVYWRCTQRECQISKDIVNTYRCMFESRISTGAVEKYKKRKPRGHLMPKRYLHGLMTWKVMQRNVWKEIANWRIKQRTVYKVATRCMEDHQFKEEEIGSVGELSIVCSQIVLKCVYIFGTNSWTWYFFGLWTNLLVRSLNGQKLVTKRLARLISYIHHTCEHRQYCFVGNTAQQCRLGLFRWLRLCRRPWRLEVNIRRNSVHFRKSHVCANKLDVQEANFSYTQFYRSWNYFSPCRFTHGWDSRSRSLWLSAWSFSFHTKPNQQNQRCQRATVKLVGKHSTKHAKTDANHAHQSQSVQYWSRSIKRNTFWLQCYVVCLLRTTKPWLKW